MASGPVDVVGSLPGRGAAAPQQQGQQECRHRGDNDRSETAEAIPIEPDHVRRCATRLPDLFVKITAVTLARKPQS